MLDVSDFLIFRCRVPLSSPIFLFFFAAAAAAAATAAATAVAAVLLRILGSLF